MKDFPIPVRAFGPGSQPEQDAELAYLEMPRGMHTFEMPRVPERVDPAAMAQSRELLARFVDELAGWDPVRQRQGPSIALDALSPAALEITNQVLGEGEVSIRIDGTRPLHIQESVFAGLWRCCELGADGQLARYWLEAGPVPRVVMDAAITAASPALVAVAWPAGAMNSPALVAEIGSRLAAFEPGAPAGQINLTHLPMSPEDHAVLAQALPVGPVAMISRGFGNCHVTSTLTRHVWRVQYFNSMTTLILNTIEVVDMPEVAIASAEDLIDSRERLAELVQWMGEGEGGDDGSAATS
jgi:hydrogenase-1 operon protein HyaF